MIHRMFGFRFWATVCRTVGPMLCLSVLSVTFVYYVQTVKWIKMPLGMEVCLGQGDIMLDGDPARSLFFGGSCQFRPKGGHSSPPAWDHCGETDGPGCHLARRQASSQATLCLMGTHLPRKGHSSLPRCFGLSAHVYCGQTAAWIKMPLIGMELDQATLC